jgi:hypothetical protein
VVPGPTPKYGVSEEADRHGPDAGEPVEGDIRLDLAPAHGLVQGRERLGAQERRRKKLVLGPDLDLVTREMQDDAAMLTVPPGYLASAAAFALFAAAPVMIVPVPGRQFFGIYRRPAGPGSIAPASPRSRCLPTALCGQEV